MRWTTNLIIPSEEWAYNWYKLKYRTLKIFKYTYYMKLNLQSKICINNLKVYKLEHKEFHILMLVTKNIQFLMIDK